MAGSMSVTGFLLPGLAEEAGEGYQNPEASNAEAEPYKIPPVVWMIIFLVVGYVGTRMLLLED